MISAIHVIIMWLHVRETTLGWLQVAWPTVREPSTGKTQLLKMIIALLGKTTAEVSLESSSDDTCYEVSRVAW